MGDQIITPLLPVDTQKSLGIPYSRNQTVVADGLEQLISRVDDIVGRPVILHVKRKEIKSLAEGLLTIQDFIGKIRLCLCDIHLLEDCDLQTYKQQLASIVDVGLMKKATGVEGRFDILNLEMSGLPERRIARCPAGIGFITIGPDGRVYPCPAFYYDGQEYSMGPIQSMSNQLETLDWNQQQCGICGSTQCPGCPFLESSYIAGREQICKLYEAENCSMKELLSRVAQSGYLFDCLRTIKTRECAMKSEREGGESLAASQQVYDVAFSEFIQALQDLKFAAETAANSSAQDDNYNSILNRWLELPEIPSTSQRSIFRRRVREILAELKQLKELTPIPMKDR